MTKKQETEAILEEELLKETLEEETLEEELSDTPDKQEEPMFSQGIIDDLEAKKLSLESEIASLEGELEKKREETDKKAREYAEFKELFPNANLDELEPEVLAMTEAGVPLSAAYALYEKRLKARNAAVKAHNMATKESGFASVGNSANEEFYTPDEVRSMTRTEVKQNYQKILRSMKSWH